MASIQELQKRLEVLEKEVYESNKNHGYYFDFWLAKEIYPRFYYSTNFLP